MAQKITLFLLLVFASSLQGQITEFKGGHVKFASSAKEIYFLSQLISIENFKNDTIYAYVSHEQVGKFLSLHIPFEKIEVSFKKQNYRKSTSIDSFNYYPKHSEYVNFLNSLKTKYPSHCNIIKFGKTVKKRDLYFIRLNSDTLIPKPSVMYTSSMHGNETGGYILMLRLADYLLKNYPNDSVAKLLVDSVDIWINPLANPDGTYGNGDDFYSPNRENGNGKDLNRNFPDAFTGNTYNPIQPETQAMINLMNKRHFVLSANFHSGAEVVNYPWDSDSSFHTDNDWFVDISKKYADLAHKYGRPGYFTDPYLSGITNGIRWYYINGGRQDYITYFHQGREVTIELDLPHFVDNNYTYITPELELANLWNYNYRSLLNYLKEATYGIHGMVKDSATGKPLKAKIEILNHDNDNSFVYSDSTGHFYRLIQSGTYDLKISSGNYFAKIIPGVKVENSKTTYLTCSLVRDGKDEINDFSNSVICLYPNPVHEILNFSIDHAINYQIRDISGRLVLSSNFKTLNVSKLKNGAYFVSLKNGQKLFFVKN